MELSIGGNAINSMIESGMQELNLLGKYCAQDLELTRDSKIQIGMNLTKGRVQVQMILAKPLLTSF